MQGEALSLQENIRRSPLELEGSLRVKPGDPWLDRDGEIDRAAAEVDMQMQMADNRGS